MNRKTEWTPCVAVMVLIALSGTVVRAALVLDDPLQGSTIGTFNGGTGQFIAGGWKIINKADAIYWHLPYTVYKGAMEFSVTGLNPNECRPGLSDKSELFHMYDYTYDNADTNYYTWVKLGNGVGWTDWSASGQWFRVDTSSAPPNYGAARVVGHSLHDNRGPFLGLGFTYMEGLGFCKHNRDRFESDLAFMSSRGFNYMRILSEVPGACDWDYWYGRSINASTYTCPHGVVAYEWPDYDQQFKDMIDIAYDKYGVRTEVTIFGGAGDSFPTYAGRQAHCQRILDLIVGREHKIVFIEVANEGWQTGFDYPRGVADMRSLCQYLADRTAVPVAISATPWGNYPDPNATLVELYSGSAADIATEHFERDIHTFEGGWLPVRDCWRVEHAAGVPPVSSDEPIGPGSSVNSENDPIKLVSAAIFAWISGLHSYVFHSSAGVRGDYRFECLSGEAIPLAPGCEPADLDGDGNVDANDLFSFSLCMGGADRPSPCAE